MLNSTNISKIEEIRTIFNNQKRTLNDALLSLFKLFKLNALCSKAGIEKQEGYSASEILKVLLLFPFMSLCTVRSLYLSRFQHLIEAKKDAIFRLKNNEHYNWRKLLYQFCKRFKTVTQPSPQHKDEQSSATPTCFILDDSTLAKAGMKIEFIGKVFDHVIRKSVLGFKLLLLGFWDGSNLLPLDFSLHNEKGKNKKYPFGLKVKQLKKRFSKQRDKNSNGYKRAKELGIDKINNGLAMLKRAVKNGFIADYFLTDSWFSSADVIKTVRQIKNGIIHFLGMVRMDKRCYEYQGQKFNAKELRKKLSQHMKRAKKLNIYYIEVIVHYDDIGNVKLFFTRLSKRSKWRLLLTTNLQLSFHQAIKIYNTRWSIEVLFKECKQLLNLGKCQSTDFDAQIADTTISMILYTILSLHKRIHCYSSLGELFAKYQDQFIESTIVEKLWHLFLIIQFTIAEILEFDFIKLMRTVMQVPTVKNITKSLLNIFVEDDFENEKEKGLKIEPFGILKLSHII